jgi:hypothetical protein
MNDDTASRAAREGIDQTMTIGADAVRGIQEGFTSAFTSALENVRDLNVRLVDMARANTDAAFNFAREASTVKGPSDLVQVWAKHATKQFDVLTKQASELNTLGQQFAKATTDSVTRVEKGPE